MRRLSPALLVAFAALTFWACAAADPVADEGTARTQQKTATAAAAAGRATTVVGRAHAAVGITFDARGRLVYAEKDRGRIIRVSRGKRHVLAKLHVAGGSEPGLLGLAFGERGRLWAHYTSPHKGCPNPTKGAGGSVIRSHCVWRLRPVKGRYKADKRIFSAPHPSSADNHNGGNLRFGPDGALYLGLGDLGENDNPTRGPRRAQDLSVPFGKMLRLDADATNKGAPGNPRTCGDADNRRQRTIRDRRIFACGLRNPYSFDFDRTGHLWVADVGDACDELDLVRAGVNYGWQPPRTDCAGSGAGRPRLTLRADGTAPTPSGVAVPKSGAWRGQVLFGIFADRSLQRFKPSSGRRVVVRQAAGRTGWDLAVRGRSLYMSDGERISRMRLPR